MVPVSSARVTSPPGPRPIRLHNWSGCYGRTRFREIRAQCEFHEDGIILYCNTQTPTRAFRVPSIIGELVGWLVFLSAVLCAIFINTGPQNNGPDYLNYRVCILKSDGLTQVMELTVLHDSIHHFINLKATEENDNIASSEECTTFSCIRFPTLWKHNNKT